ncbi:hypothetical protein Rumeso_03590 [Rubellimicrobium mesophilum DSM 19309]|uniref:Uncharacterized protein n=1 Tax=Rubellimicrobium mesophilum DSM 19309 TaxID=442562 RepID=A0A017HKX2_9RHOB|nr:hypothetical protein [Rubellimicrobium mesophilum]EYD74823.1 hypothetical protein Rumeso_03590 [Rubellimicrobium mesophilum DSM 19309]
MTADHDVDPHAEVRAALALCWLWGQRLVRARRRALGLLPTSPDRLTRLGREDEERLGALLFCLGAAVTALIEEVMEPVLLAEHSLILLLDVADDLRALEATGAIASAEAVLALRERVWRHYRIPALAPEPRVAALNQAWADGQAMAEILTGLSRHIQRKGLVPGLRPFGKGPP